MQRGQKMPAQRVEGKLQEVAGPHDVWAMGVVHGRQATGRNAERGLRQLLVRNGNKVNKLISETAGLLRNFGRLTAQPDKVQEILKKLASKVALPPQRGMTPKNRDRLRVLQDERMMRRLLHLPEHLFVNPPQGKANTYTKALAREDAVAIGILLYCPIRVKNLANIHLDRHLQRLGDGRVFLVLTEEDTKTERPLEFELPADLVRMIDAHLKMRCPEMCPKGTPWLFPRRDGKAPMKEAQLSGRIKKRIRENLGAEMNAHLFRHFAVMLLLDAQPGSYEVARRLLGHSEVSHTINMYSKLEMKTAIKRFAELVSEKTGVPWEAKVPVQVEPLLRRYIYEVRPALIARGRQRHNRLWVCKKGEAFDENYLGSRIGSLPLELTSKRIPPHFFRDVAATTLARMSPEAAKLIRPVLAHSGFKTAERHYIHAQTIDAGRAYAEVVKKMKKGMTIRSH